MTDDPTIGKRFRDLRARRGLTQAKAAAYLAETGLPWRQQTVAKVEKDLRPVSLAEALVIADRLAAPEWWAAS
jgi:transcriptional regulator with XRE-family HTH domain